MNQQSISKIVKTCLLLILLWIVIPVFAQGEITVTAKQNLALQSKPDYDSEVLGVFLRGQEATAFGRSEDGSWLHLSDGWVAAKNVAADGDMMKLPVTTHAVTLKAADSRSLRSGPDESFDVSGSLPRGETMIALGRNADGTWLQVSSGWIPAGQVEIFGDVMGLPLTFAGFTIRANYNVALHSAPSRDAEVRAILGRGEEVIVIGRNEDGTAVQTLKGWVFVSRGLRLEGDMTGLPIVPSVTLTATQTLTLYSGPRLNFDRLDVLEGGEQAIAFGRDEAGTWLQIPGGWVSIERGLESSGSIMDLPITGYAGIKITVIRSIVSVRSEPRFGATVNVIRTLGKDEEAIAIGRSGDGEWLQIEDGWVYYSSRVKADGDIMSLPVITEATSAISSTAATSRSASTGIKITAILTATSVRSEPSFGENAIKTLRKDEEAIAIGRSEDGKWLRIEDGWVSASSYRVDGDIMSLPVITGTDSAISSTAATSRSASAGIKITAILTATSVRSEPSFGENAIKTLRKDEEAIAIGRSGDGKWLQIEDGWVSASSYRVDGDIMSLPVITEATSAISATAATSKSMPAGIKITVSGSFAVVRSEPSFRQNAIKRLQKGEEAIAIGRNEDGRWLRIEDGWFYYYSSSVKADGDIMDLPVVTETASAISSNTSRRRATPTPAPTFSESNIRSLVSRYTDDIRILKITQRGSTTAIEYDLKSWPFVPNELIAEEVVFKVICALDKGERIPHKLEFVGQANFTSDVGRKFKSPSVEIHISASNANRIVCSGNSYTDINWRSISSLYKSYPIPRGASVDYD